MIIEGEIFEDLSITGISQKSMNINQSDDVVVIDKHQAAQLIEVLRHCVLRQCR